MLTCCYVIAGTALAAVGSAKTLGMALALFMIALLALGAGNGSVFQLLPQRFGKELGLMTGLVGAGGGVGAFLLATALGWSKGQTGSYDAGFTAFAGLCVVALIGLTLVKKRWRNTWGALAAARI
jgi:NNP family nitrate/nitrite transporter-like MFS transporter